MCEQPLHLVRATFEYPRCTFWTLTDGGTQALLRDSADRFCTHSHSVSSVAVMWEFRMEA